MATQVPAIVASVIGLSIAMSSAVSSQSAGDSALIESLKRTPASNVERGLPRVPFERWLTAILGPDLSWEVNDCGEGHPGLVCVEVDESERHAVLMIVVNANATRIVRPPALFFGAIKLFDVDHNFRSLVNLPDLVKEGDRRKLKFKDYPLRTLSNDEAVTIAQRVPAQSLDNSLPTQPFGQWFAALMPAGSRMSWRQMGCAGLNTQPACVDATAEWPDGSRAHVTLTLEMIQRGIGDHPVFKSAGMYDRKRGGVAEFVSLSAFASTLTRR
jgi:hypothetical protein